MNHYEKVGGLPSASKFEIAALCPGQPQLEKELRALNKAMDDSNPYTETGTRIHKARETMDSSGLDEDELITFQQGIACERAALQAWEEEFKLDFPSEYKERQIWLHWPEDSAKSLEPATSATIDVHYVAPDRVLIVEWKTLYCSNLTPAESNYQGMVQAVCVAKEYNVQHVRVVFNKAKFGKIDAVDYDAHTLKWAQDEIFRALWKNGQPGAALQAGGWCNHCPCRSNCVSAAGYALVPTVIAGSVMNQSKADIESMVQRLSPADWKYIWLRSTEIGNIIEAANKCLKQLNPDDLRELGLKMKEGKNLDPITDIKGCYEFLLNEGHLNPGRLWSCMQFSKGGIVESIQAQKNMTKKAAQEWLKVNLAQFQTKQKSAGSLEEI